MVASLGPGCNISVLIWSGRAVNSEGGDRQRDTEGTEISLLKKITTLLYCDPKRGRSLTKREKANGKN